MWPVIFQDVFYAQMVQCVFGASLATMRIITLANLVSSIADYAILIHIATHVQVPTILYPTILAFLAIIPY